ncbi:DUF6186 family protein [Nocardia spumae]|uniref:DUF6186 family protein n=1 Tax=Nocardia spumae TaxID=2887190 RepID=UPI001D14105E|nr:DUF6186 family protein [Nocardia spumae]
MTDRVLIVTGFAVLIAVLVLAAVAIRLRRLSWAALGETVRYLTRTAPARIAAVVVWAWLGWHFLAR